MVILRHRLFIHPTFRPTAKGFIHSDNRSHKEADVQPVVSISDFYIATEELFYYDRQ